MANPKSSGRICDVGQEVKRAMGDKNDRRLWSSLVSENSKESTVWREKRTEVVENCTRPKFTLTGRGNPFYYCDLFIEPSSSVPIDFAANGTTSPPSSRPF